jgi:PAS domain S-box-containing protein
MQSENIRVLLIEDDAVDQLAFLRAVKEQALPYEVCIAGSVAGARQALAEGEFDVIVTDHELGDGDAFEIFDKLITTPTIFTTGAGDEAIAVKAMKVGASDYLIKDTERHYLSALPIRIAAALQHQRDRKALQESDERFRALADSSPIGFFQTDVEGNCIYVNPQWLQILGRRSEDVLGMGWANAIHPEDRGMVVDTWAESRRGGGIFSLEFRIVRPDGAVRWVHGRTAAMRLGERILGYMGTSEDITERHLTDEQLRKSIAEKEVLLREIHHRVKNNLQVVTSLLQLQSGSIQDPAVVEQFRETQQRVRAMALIHEKLYQSADLNDIDFAEYLRGLVPLVTRSNSRGAIVETKLEIDPCVLDMDRAMPLGLITSELVSNSLKHAFSARQRGAITVRLTSQRGGAIVLTVSDDGDGLPESFDPAASKSLGMRLVRALTGQLGGTFTFQNNPGACFQVSFPHQAEHPNDS